MIFMPMYKKSLCILLFIALIAGGSIFYNYSATEETVLDTPSGTVENTVPQNDVTVYVSGEVTSPGLVTLSSTSRVKDAISACGDFTPLADKNGVNLAQKLTDGMQINVPAQTIKQNTAENSAASLDLMQNSADNTEIVNINTATKEQLDTLPGIGPATADKIIEYRQTNGPFQSVEDIKNVRGIGDAKFSKMQSRIRI